MYLILNLPQAIKSLPVTAVLFWIYDGQSGYGSVMFSVLFSSEKINKSA